MKKTFVIPAKAGIQFNKIPGSRIKYGMTIVFMLISLIVPSSVSAHVLATDGSIGAILHIDPDDEPIAGSQASFFFDFKDKQNKFKPENCNCTFLIIEDGKEIYTQALFQNNNDPSLTSASVFFTFPEKNVYQVKVKGIPNTTNAFQTFTLNYDVRVDREVSQSGSNHDGHSWFELHSVHIIGGIIAFAFLAFVVFKKSQSKTNE